MSRVKAVVSKSIMVALEDVRPNDILSSAGSEADPIIERIEFDGQHYKLHYKDRKDFEIKESIWMDPELGGHIFIHDLYNERADFIEED